MRADELSARDATAAPAGDAVSHGASSGARRSGDAPPGNAPFGKAPLSADELRRLAGAYGDEVAAATWRGVFQSYDAMLRREVVRWVGALDWEGEDDIVGRVWQTAVERLEEYRGEGSFGGWLVGMARNHLLSTHRRAKRRENLLRAHEPQTDATTEDPLARLIRAEDEATRDRLLAVLSPDDRRLLLWRDVEGVSRAEIALRLGLAPATVGKKLYRIRERLRAALANAAGPGRTDREGARQP